ncbi:hypothetical protein WN51_14159 [Melipona quadrifasciata]|uniref:Uncharacterized protein n=1 Tax=Melipona quadrifasciata TaxID=166423 RepID=A0A0M9A1T6_9HYME|nr:hypothetical protein WN51_14159 [Melipona quadrifasciata]
MGDHYHFNNSHFTSSLLSSIDYRHRGPSFSYRFEIHTNYKFPYHSVASRNHRMEKRNCKVFINPGCSWEGGREKGKAIAFRLGLRLISGTDGNATPYPRRLLLQLPARLDGPSVLAVLPPSERYLHVSSELQAAESMEMLRTLRLENKVLKFLEGTVKYLKTLDAAGKEEEKETHGSDSLPQTLRPRIPQIRVSNTRLAQAANGCAPSVDVLPIFDVKQQSVRNPARMGDRPKELVTYEPISKRSEGLFKALFTGFETIRLRTTTVRNEFQLSVFLVKTTFPQKEISTKYWLVLIPDDLRCAFTPERKLDSIARMEHLLITDDILSQGDGMHDGRIDRFDIDEKEKVAFRLGVTAQDSSSVGLMAATPYLRRLLLQLPARLDGPCILAVLPHSALFKRRRSAGLRCEARSHLRLVLFSSNQIKQLPTHTLSILRNINRANVDITMLIDTLIRISFSKKHFCFHYYWMLCRKAMSRNSSRTKDYQLSVT